MPSKIIPPHLGAEGTLRPGRSAGSLLQNAEELTEILRLGINLLHHQPMPLFQVRQEKVSALQERVQRGGYKVDPELIAVALLRRATLKSKVVLSRLAPEPSASDARFSASGPAQRATGAQQLRLQNSEAVRRHAAEDF